MTDEEKLISQAIWIAHSLFERNKVTGSAANLSFKLNGVVYITASGSCFGTLSQEDFSATDLNGQLLKGREPSKELPLHQILYGKDSSIQAIVHTHSFYSVLWSMEDFGNEADCVPEYTPYLRMRLGTVGLVDYAKPGSNELFDAFRKVLNLSDGYILKNHGPIIGGKTLMDAFYNLEELEESCKMAWHVKHYCGIQSQTKQP